MPFANPTPVPWIFHPFGSVAVVAPGWLFLVPHFSWICLSAAVSGGREKYSSLKLLPSAVLVLSCCLSSSFQIFHWLPKQVSALIGMLSTGIYTVPLLCFICRSFFGMSSFFRDFSKCFTSTWSRRRCSCSRASFWPFVALVYLSIA